MTKRRIGLVLAAVCAVGLVVSAVTSGFTGHVIDGATGKPAAGIYVIGRWEGGGGLVGGASGCWIAVTRSDANGEFTLRRGTGLYSRLFAPRYRPAVYFYKAGYMARFPIPEDQRAPLVIEAVQMEVMDRLAHLRQIQTWVDCGIEEIQNNAALLIPMYKAMIVEASAIAGTHGERQAAATLEYWLDVAQDGVDVARQKSAARTKKFASEK